MTYCSTRINQGLSCSNFPNYLFFLKLVTVPLCGHIKVKTITNPYRRN